MQKSSRNNLHRFDNPKEEAILSLPDKNNRGAWSAEHEARLKIAEEMVAECDSIAAIIRKSKAVSIRNHYTLEMYEQVNQMARFSAHALLTLKDFDLAITGEDEKNALEAIKQLPSEFRSTRSKLESVYGQTRILNKPANYILDQDHHTHAANQSINFDWQFYAEMLFLEKIIENFK